MNNLPITNKNKWTRNKTMFDFDFYITFGNTPTECIYKSENNTRIVHDNQMEFNGSHSIEGIIIFYEKE